MFAAVAAEAALTFSFCYLKVACHADGAAAAQVVMSRGGYTSAIDMWSLGCIFGELIQRVSRVGSANTPHLQVICQWHSQLQLSSRHHSRTETSEWAGWNKHRVSKR